MTLEIEVMIMRRGHHSINDRARLAILFRQLVTAIPKRKEAHTALLAHDDSSNACRQSIRCSTSLLQTRKFVIDFIANDAFVDTGPVVYDAPW